MSEPQPSTATASRRKHAIESHGTARATLGPIVKGTSLFCLTRGQFSLIDAFAHVLDACAPARVSVWTWRIAEHDLDILHARADAGHITEALLVIDQSLARIAESTQVGKHLVRWADRFGRESISYLKTHAKIATVEGNGMRVLIRGSLNLNCNRRLEQLDITEGGPDFDLMRRVEDELPRMEASADSQSVDAATMGRAPIASAFGDLKTWTK